jgi:hypothetical protein
MRVPHELVLQLDAVLPVVVDPPPPEPPQPARVRAVTAIPASDRQRNDRSRVSVSMDRLLGECVQSPKRSVGPMVDANGQMSPSSDGFVTDLLCNPGDYCQNAFRTGDAETNQEVALTNERPG